MNRARCAPRKDKYAGAPAKGSTPFHDRAPSLSTRKSRYRYITSHAGQTHVHDLRFQLKLGRMRLRAHISSKETLIVHDSRLLPSEELIIAALNQLNDLATKM